MKKKRGSILIYVMMIFAVLMIMGATLSMLTMQNIKNRKHYSKSRVNLYYSESGLDQAYGILKEYVNEASDYALMNTNIDIQDKIDDDTKILNGTAVGKLELYKDSGELDKEKLKSLQDRLFEKYYIKYFNKETGSDKNFKIMISHIQRAYSGVDGSNVIVEVLNANDYMQTDAEITGPFTLSLQSTFIRDNIEKRIKADFEFQIPEYASKLSFPVKYTTVAMTPVMNKGLVVNKQLKIDGGLDVLGSIYVKGEDNKGIVMASHESELTVEGGSVTACEGVEYDYNQPFDQTKERTAQGAKLNIVNGNLYTKNILLSRKKETRNGVEHKLDGSQGSKLIVSGDVYVHDDLQIDADYSTVTVGDYFGVSDGSTETLNKIDNSSSIIINTEDVGKDGTEINIIESIILAGTSYIRNLKSPVLTGDYSYQTGESISVKGNYVAYSYPFKNSKKLSTKNYGEKDYKYDLERTLLSPLTLITHYDRYSKWFSIYGEGENREILVNLNDGYKEKYSNARFFKIEGIDEVIPLYRKSKLSSSNIQNNIRFNTIGDKNELKLILLQQDKTSPAGSIVAKKIEEDIEVFLYEENGSKWIYTEITPKGAIEDSLRRVVNYSTSSSEIANKKGDFNKFIKVSSVNTDISDTINITCYDSFGNDIGTYNTVVQDYKLNFDNVATEDKSKIFKNFYDENNDSGEIKGLDGISVGDLSKDENLSKSIYAGAILSKEKGVNDQNYYKNFYKNELIIQHRGDVLKDKVYYMDVFEKKFDGQNDNPYNDKEIDEFNFTSNSLYSVIPVEKKPRQTRTYQLTPDSFINLSKDSIKNNNRFSNSGLFVNYDEKRDILLTNKKTNICLGEVFSEEDTVKINNSQYGIIVCNGDLYMKGDFTFTGTIIVMGNVFVEKDTDKNANIKIIYDESIVANIVDSEKQVTEDIFKEHPQYKSDKVSVVFYEEISKDDTSVPLRINKWVVVK